MRDLTEQELDLLRQIPAAIAGDPGEPDFAPVMGATAWSVIIGLPPELVETHARFRPVISVRGRMAVGAGFVRLTEAGKVLINTTGPVPAERED